MIVHDSFDKLWIIHWNVFRYGAGSSFSWIMNSNSVVHSFPKFSQIILYITDKVLIYLNLYRVLVLEASTPFKPYQQCDVNGKSMLCAPNDRFYNILTPINEEKFLYAQRCHYSYMFSKYWKNFILCKRRAFIFIIALFTNLWECLIDANQIFKKQPWICMS